MFHFTLRIIKIKKMVFDESSPFFFFNSNEKDSQYFMTFTRE